MAVRVSVKKENTHTHLGVRIVGVRGWRAWRAEGWHADVDLHKERREKKQGKNTYLVRKSTHSYEHTLVAIPVPRSVDLAIFEVQYMN